MPRKNKAFSPNLTERDIKLFLMMYRYGFLSLNQIDRWFFEADGTKKPKRTTYLRLAKLESAQGGGYIRKFSNKDDFRFKEPVYCLAQRAIDEVIRDYLGIDADDKVFFVNSPPKGRLGHDILLNELFKGLEGGFLSSDTWSLDRVLNQFQLYRIARGNPVNFVRPDGTSGLKEVIPDIFFQGSDRDGNSFRLVLELENNTRNPAAIAAEKVAPLVQWMISPEYKNQFGINGGRVLLVANVTSDKFENVCKKIVDAGGSSIFLLARFDDCVDLDLLHSPIWRLAYKSNPLTLAQFLTSQFQRRIRDELTFLDLPRVQLIK